MFHLQSHCSGPSFCIVQAHSSLTLCHLFIGNNVDIHTDSVNWVCHLAAQSTIEKQQMQL